MASPITPDQNEYKDYRFDTALLYEVSGKEAREIIINSLKAINGGAMNASTLNGKTADDYLKYEDMINRINACSAKIEKDDKPSLTSEHLIMTKGIRSVVGPVPFLSGG